MEKYNWKRDCKQPMDVGVRPCYYCGEPVGLFSPHAVERHLEDGVLEAFCPERPESVYPTNQDWGPRN